jgi:hypothetical protein
LMSNDVSMRAQARFAQGAIPRIRWARFGAVELDLRAGELHANGRRIRLQNQPFQLRSETTAVGGHKPWISRSPRSSQPSGGGTLIAPLLQL